MDKEEALASKLGYLFYFQCNDNQITCYKSYFSGKEEVYLNDDLLSRKRSFALNSHHAIDIQGTRYDIVYQLVKPLIGKVTCSFLFDNTLILAQSQSLFNGNNKSANNVLLRCFAVGFVAGALGYVAGKYLFAWL